MATVTLALCLLLGAALSAAADASPADLRSVIAPPPANDYIEASAKPDQLDGAFDAKGYADFISAVNDDDASSLEGYLTRYGFTRGYGVTWIERGTRNYFEVFVFEFKRPTGAQLWFADEKDGTSTMDEYRGELAGGTTIPGAWTGRVSSSGSFGAYRVGFVKGNDYYVLSLDSSTADLTSIVLRQAQAQYDFAPKSTLPPGVVPPAVAAANSNRNTMTAVAWVVGGMITIVLIGTIVIVLLLLFRRRTPAAVPVQSLYSDIPLDATRSPDGAYWWDGVTWRPVVPPRSPYEGLKL